MAAGIFKKMWIVKKFKEAKVAIKRWFEPKAFEVKNLPIAISSAPPVVERRVHIDTPPELEYTNKPSYKPQDYKNISRIKPILKK